MRTTITAGSPVRSGSWLSVDDEPNLFLVVACTGSGPYSLTIRRVHWFDRVWAWLRFQVRKPREWWLNTRCLPDDAWCWRKATADYLCDRHWLLAVEDGAEDL